jgi:hypothetical protein
VNDPFGVREVEGFGDAGTERRDERRLESPLHLQHFVEGLPLDVLHDDEEEAITLLDGIDRHDPGVVESCRRSRFGDEAILQPGDVDEIREHHLDGDTSLQGEIAREKNRRHAAPADLLLDRVFVLHRGANASEEQGGADAHQSG